MFCFCQYAEPQSDSVSLQETSPMKENPKYVYYIQRICGKIYFGILILFAGQYFVSGRHAYGNIYPRNVITDVFRSAGTLISAVKVIYILVQI